MTHRLAKLGERLLPNHAEGITLEELCRSVWKDDPDAFREIALGNTLSFFLPMFEREAAGQKESAVKSVDS